MHIGRIKWKCSPCPKEIGANSKNQICFITITLYHIAESFTNELEVKCSKQNTELILQLAPNINCNKMAASASSPISAEAWGGSNKLNLIITNILIKMYIAFTQEHHYAAPNP